jgi:sugar phosphate isomerase/epimerase
MNNSRRAFLQKTALVLAGTTMLSRELFAARKGKEILGVQLYSVRDAMGKDPEGTLKLIADMGYGYVEHANYNQKKDRKFYGFTAAEFRKILDGLGLKMRSGHTVMRKDHWDEAKNDFTDEWKFTVDDAATVGQKYVISPWLDDSMRKTFDDFKRYMDVFNKSGELCKKSGMKFGYHNHDFEFTTVLNGSKLYDLILNNTDPSLVAQQLDMGNLYNGGATAIDVAKKFPGRFELMHVKDEIKTTGGAEKYTSTILGQGIVGTKEVVDWGRDSGGTTDFIIEQEAFQGKSSVDSVKEDLAVMKKWGY